MNSPPHPSDRAAFSPYWPTCAHGAAAPGDPGDCWGIRIPGHTSCLAHLDGVDRDAYLAGLSPGSDIDHRGTPFTPELLARLLGALRDRETHEPRIGTSRFEWATFHSDAAFQSTVFQDHAHFGSATFEGDALFTHAVFKKQAEFESARFERRTGFILSTFESAHFEHAEFQDHALFESVTFKSATFSSATFQGLALFGTTTFLGADFSHATFHHQASFTTARFQDTASFTAAKFGGSVHFAWARFKCPAVFERAVFQHDVELRSAIFDQALRCNRALFEGPALIGPLVCADRVDLSEATFNKPVTLYVAARNLLCQRTRWASTAEVRLRYATADLSQAVFEYPLTITAEADPLPECGAEEHQVFASTPRAEVRLASLRGVDATHLVVADVDLSQCLLTGTMNLDQVRLEGSCTFSSVPAGIHWTRRHWARFTERQTLAEEHHWRARRPGALSGWTPAGPEAVPAGPRNLASRRATLVGPAQLAPVYRALRKAMEDRGNAPGAADFYYGEMEMRRHDRGGTPGAERALLTVYWAVSGYGLRASRALTWLAAAMVTTAVLLMGFGLAEESPKQEVTGIVPSGSGPVTFEIDKTAPENPTGDRFTGERFEEALNITLNSALFRSSGKGLTTAGTYVEMASRLVEPVLLGLAVLAVRGRVKR